MLDNGNIVSEGTSMEVLNDDKLKNVYDIDIKSFMKNILNKDIINK